MGLSDQIQSLIKLQKLYIGKSIMIYALGAWIAQV